MPGSLRILHLEDLPTDAELIAAVLEKEFGTCQIIQVDTREGFERELQRDLDLILSDFSLPAFDGLSALRMARRARPEVPFILISGNIGEDMAVECLKLGATDYVLKTKLVRLPPVVKRALEERDEHKARAAAEEELHGALLTLSDMKAALDESALVQIVEPFGGTLTYVNEKYSELTGYSKAELLGQSYMMDCVGVNPPERLQRIREAIYGGRIWRGEIRSKRKDGRILWRQLTLVPFLDAAGNILQFLGVGFDITSQKTAEEKMRDMADARLELLEAASAAKVVPWEQDAQGAWKLGDSVFQILGYRAEFLGERPRMVESLMHPEDLHRLVAVRTQSESRKVRGFDCRLRHQDGRWIWTRWTLGYAQGAYRGVIQDISELHEVQEQLLESQKAELVGVMVGGMVHDLKNINTAILGSVDVLKNSGTLSESQRRILSTIQKASTRCNDLAEGLLNFVRHGVSRVRSPQNLNRLLDEIRPLLLHSLRADVDLVVEPTLDPPMAFADGGRLVQAVMNLGVNARDAITPPGRIILRTGRCEIGSREAEKRGCLSGPYVFLEVEDTGSGIPSELLEKIYEPFFTTKEPGKGTGLGLSMVRAFVQEQDGLLDCVTRVGNGTRFRILLPEWEDHSGQDEAAKPHATHA